MKKKHHRITSNGLNNHRAQTQEGFVTHTQTLVSHHRPGLHGKKISSLSQLRIDILVSNYPLTESLSIFNIKKLVSIQLHVLGHSYNCFNLIWNDVFLGNLYRVFVFKLANISSTMYNYSFSFVGINHRVK